MLCSFCGTDNRPEYKFCGMCGVRLERRQAERRMSQGASTKCPDCSHVNDSSQKFCGMCGSRVERRLQERRSTGSTEGEPRAVAIANAQLPTPDIISKTKPQVVTTAPSTPDIPVSLPRKAEPAIFRNDPVKEPYVQNTKNTEISGPSFLGLGAQSEGDGDYLLEDEPSRGGFKKFLFLVILAAIAGLIFMQWRSSLKANPKNPPKSEPASSTPATPPQGSNQAPSTPGSSNQSTQAASSSADNVEASTAKDPAKDPKSATDDKGAPTDPSGTVSETPGSSAAANPAENSTEKTSSKKPDSGDDPPPTAETKSADAKPADDRKPSAALIRAQQYLQGRGGVQQNCEQGLLYLRAATEKSDPGAAIQMAALYSSGHCVKQDRVMAYRWFNSAHELEPANMWIQKNMDQLWAQMTTQERRLAGY